jgi:glyoxylase-like metal-dependent hydrolase (beta-lactamase superfamily II)
MSKKPDVAKLKATENERKLIKALEYSPDPSVRIEAASALGAVGKITALKPLVRLMNNTAELIEVRSEAICAVGKLCAKIMEIHSSENTDSPAVSGTRRQKEINELQESRKALRMIIKESSSPLSSAAANACMSLPLDRDSAIMKAFNSVGKEDEKSVFSQPVHDSSEEKSSIEDASVETAEQANTFSVSEETASTHNTKQAETEEEEIEMREPDLDKPVEIAPGTYWVGRREDTLLERNIYLRVFSNGGKTVNLLIDPGPPEDLTPLVKKLSSVIGGIRNLHVMFLNHQDPDVSYNSGHLQKLNPNCIVLCSEDSWRLVKFYGLDPSKYKAVESFKNMKVTLSTGHTLRFIPTPYCHFRGAVMLFDEETGVLFSGDFLGGLSFKQDLYASSESWDGIATFHQIYMPSQGALKHAVNNIREMKNAPSIVAPQHGSIITGELVQDFLGRVENLEVGLDLFLKDHTKKNYVAALNELLAEFSQIVDSSIIPRALSAFMSDGSFPNAITLGESGVTDIKVDAQYAVEIFLRELRQQTPSDLLDLVDISIVRVLTMWKIPLPEFMLVKSSQQESVFEGL